MHRIIVDFPDPDGPATTPTSPGHTRKAMPRKTCSFPNHLWTSSSAMIGSPPCAGAVARWSGRGTADSPGSLTSLLTLCHLSSVYRRISARRHLLPATASLSLPKSQPLDSPLHGSLVAFG